MAASHVAPAMPDAAAKVTVALAIDPSYGRKMGDPFCTSRCQAILARVADSITALLGAQFAFVEWSRTSAALDTLELRWVHPEPTPELDFSRLAFTLRGPRRTALAPGYSVDFENFMHLDDRGQDPILWEADTVAGTWFSLFANLLQGDDSLESTVIFEIPVADSIDLRGTGFVFVPVSARSLGLENQAFIPEFYAWAEVSDSLPRPGRRVRGRFRLTKCQESGGVGYACIPEVLEYVNDIRRDQRLQEVRDNSQIDVTSVHVATYQAVPLAFRPQATTKLP